MSFVAWVCVYRISYDRRLLISAALANTITSCFEMSLGVGPCPPGLHVGVFTTTAVDNIDHNPSSTTASDSFHVTAISLTQHRSSVSDGIEISRGVCDLSDGCKTI